VFGACFEGLIISKYGFANVLGSGFKYIHCDLVNPLKYLTIIFKVGSNFVSTFSLHLNAGSFIQVLNYRVNFKNRFERGDWEFVLQLRLLLLLNRLNLFLCTCALSSHIQYYISCRVNLEELGTMELVVIRIYAQFAKAFILVVVDGLCNNDAQALSFYLWVPCTIHVAS
jgi:hypothetical protein